MNAKKDIIKSIVVLTLISLIVTAIMATVNHFTEPVSTKNAMDRALRARQEIMPDAASFEMLETENLSQGVVEAYRGVSEDGETLGYIFISEANGFGGTISVMCGIDDEGKIILVKTMDVSSETSTLGGKTANPDYTEQYNGEDATLSNVHAISGATITSKAYEACVHFAFEAYAVVKEANQ